MSIIKIDSIKLQNKANENRIEDLKRMLKDSDYKTLPDYDNDADDIKAQRQAWRDEIRTLKNKQA